MTEAQAVDPGRQRYVLNPPPPLRALAIASAAAVLGALLIVAWNVGRWPVAVLVLGIVVLAFSVALAGAAAILTRRLRTTVEVGAATLAIERGTARRTYPWSDIKQVRLSGPRLTFVTRTGEENPSTLNPRGESDPTFAALLHDVQQRMDADRGYRL